MITAKQLADELVRRAEKGEACCWMHADDVADDMARARGQWKGRRRHGMTYKTFCKAYGMFLAQLGPEGHEKQKLAHRREYLDMIDDNDFPPESRAALIQSAEERWRLEDANPA